MRAFGGAVRVLAAVTAFVLASPARADYILGIDAFPTPPFSAITDVFPNWYRFPAGSFMVRVADDTFGAGWCTNSAIIGVTIYNYGTASGSAPGGGGDIEGVFFWLKCNATDSGMRTMTYAGYWPVGLDSYHAWTWAGSIPFVQEPSDPPGGGSKGCGIGTDPPEAGAGLYIYADVSPCPTNGATVELGPGFNDLLNPGCPGGVYDWDTVLGTSCWSCGNWAPARPATMKTIRYILKKADRESAAPGDPVNYTIYYGLPGKTPLTSLTVIDSIPNYTHYLAGAGTPAPDLGWAPDAGPPIRVRWTLPAVDPIARRGATGQITFAATVDWGNMEWFEPGSGDVGAPERQFLENQADLSWTPDTTCTSGRTSNTLETVVARFLFWKIGDNDVLFSSRIGLPDDEMIYEIFIKNLSGTRKWWNVAIWDSVPPELDVWQSGCGHYDPCVGWTMTPSGCAPAAAGKMLTGPKSETTLLTWMLDMPAGMTLSLRWKSKVKTSVGDGSIATNIASIMSYGRTAIIGGSGSSGVPRNFTHLANIILRTTYYSYTSYSGSIQVGDVANGEFDYFIPFFPLNKQTNFDLRKLEYNASAGVALTGGKSATINTLVGSCVGGFGDGGLSTPGCKVERAPAIYWPALQHPPFLNLLYKVTSNSPVLWQTLSRTINSNNDAATYAPSTSLSFCGFGHYACLRPATDNIATPGYGDRLAVINTSMNPSGVFDSALATTVHVFKWNAATSSWDFITTGDVAPESVWMPLEGTYATDPNTVQYARVISSDAQNIVFHGFHTFGNPGIGGAYDNWGTMAPCRETGNLVGGAGSNFYLICHHNAEPNAYVGNVGPNVATYRVYKYLPTSTVAPQYFPVTLAGRRGNWILKGTHTVQPGLDTPATGPMLPDGNAHVYGQGNFDPLVTNSQQQATAWKFQVLSGGPVQVGGGARAWGHCAGASTLHDALGEQAGQEFWVNAAETSGCGLTAKSGCYTPLYVNVFCPKTGMAMNINSTGGWSATYTTDGPDQVIVFTRMTTLGGGVQHNYRIQLLAAGSQGNVITQYQQCGPYEKAFTAPFVRTGTHYEIIVPPVVYIGQNFWITVIVIDSSGGTMDDYTGTTAFTSTDVNAKIQGGAMGSFTYVWTGTGAGKDNGVHIFVNVSYQQIGLQTIVATDTMDGSIIGVATLMVVGVDVKLTKERRLAIAASGDTIQFRVCWSNYSSASANNFVITDAIPMGTTYVPDAATDALCNPVPGLGLVFSYSTSTSPTPPAAFNTVTGGSTPPATTRWLRWTIDQVKVNMSGCVCYRLKID